MPNENKLEMKIFCLHMLVIVGTLEKTNQEGFGVFYFLSNLNEVCFTIITWQVFWEKKRF